MTNETIELGHEDGTPNFNFCERKIGQPYSESFGNVYFITNRISEDVVRMTRIEIVDTVSDSTNVTDIDLKLEHIEVPKQVKRCGKFMCKAPPEPGIRHRHNEPLPEGVRFEAEIEHPYALVTIKRIAGNKKIVSFTTYQNVSMVPLSYPIDRPQ